MKLHSKICLDCSSDYMGRKSSKFCSMKCVSNYQWRNNPNMIAGAIKHRGGANKKCECCGNGFYVPSYRVKSSKFCSRECQNKRQYKDITTNYICNGCGGEFTTSPSRKKKKFCSVDCYRKEIKKESESRAKQNAYNRLHRNKAGSRGLKRTLKNLRDLHCDICGYKDYEYCLDIHHIDGNCDNNELHNLAVLCCICHRRGHKEDLDDASQKRFFSGDYRHKHKRNDGKRTQ